MDKITILDKDFIPFISAEKIQDRIREIALAMDKDYINKDPLFISVLNGSFIFSADLIRALSFSAQITFIKVASYENLQSTGTVKELIGLNEDIFDRDLVIIEDIIDTGKTVDELIKQFTPLKPKSIKTVTLLYKPQALIHGAKPDYVGFEIPNKFVVGYGLDYNGYGREKKGVFQLA